MSMYSLIHGENSVAELILATLGFAKGDVPRYRDCFVAEGKIAIYTRMGGGNRGHWDMYDDESDSPGPNCPCPGCKAEHVLARHANYLHDQDDDFDSTYATYYFSFPERNKELLSQLESGKFEPDARWAEALNRLREGEETREQRAFGVGLAAMLEEGLNGNEAQTITVDEATRRGESILAESN